MIPLRSSPCQVNLVPPLPASRPWRGLPGCRSRRARCKDPATFASRVRSIDSDDRGVHGGRGVVAARVSEPPMERQPRHAGAGGGTSTPGGPEAATGLVSPRTMHLPKLNPPVRTEGGKNAVGENRWPAKPAVSATSLRRLPAPECTLFSLRGWDFELSSDREPDSWDETLESGAPTARRASSRDHRFSVKIRTP